MKRPQFTITLEQESDPLKIPKDKQFIKHLQEALLLSLLEDKTINKRQFDRIRAKL